MLVLSKTYAAGSFNQHPGLVTSCLSPLRKSFTFQINGNLHLNPKTANNLSTRSAGNQPFGTRPPPFPKKKLRPPASPPGARHPRALALSARLQEAVDPRHREDAARAPGARGLGLADKQSRRRKRRARREGKKDEGDGFAPRQGKTRGGDDQGVLFPKWRTMFMLFPQNGRRLVVFLKMVDQGFGFLKMVDLPPPSLTCFFFPSVVFKHQPKQGSKSKRTGPQYGWFNQTDFGPIPPRGWCHPILPDLS